jgi:hypothetical protein
VLAIDNDYEGEFLIKIIEKVVIKGFTVNCYSLDRVAHRDTNKQVQSGYEKFGRFERSLSNTSAASSI